MFITKKALPRRTFLRGLGATVALPFLDAMVPSLSAAAKPAPRLGFFYVPNGVAMPQWWGNGEWVAPPSGPLEISPILRPLAAYQDQMVVVSGLSNTSAMKGIGSGPHTRAHATWLCGVTPKHTEGADVQAGITIDQCFARELGRDTPLMSLELALEPNYTVGNCDNGYSCIYVNTFSWRTATTPLPMENNPRVVFERLFGDGSSPEERSANMRNDRSILDWVSDDIVSLHKRIGAHDRTTVTEYLDSVREVERRIQLIEKQSADSPFAATMEKPIGIPESYDDHSRLMYDLQFLTYQADISRVVAFQIMRETSQRTYPEIGVPEGHHKVSHHGGDPEKIGLLSKINTKHLSLFAHLVERMHATADGDGTLLDHSMLLYGGGMGNSDLHDPRDLPTLLVGGLRGRIRGGRHIKVPLHTPMMNLGLTLLDGVGIDMETLGDSTGRISEL